MSEKIHTRFLSLAEVHGDPLVDAITHVGPIRWSRERPDSMPELLCRAVAGQQLSTLAARAIWSRVLERTGDRPLIPYLARCRESTLCGCGLSRAKAKTLRGIARATESGELDPKVLAHMEHAERSERLTALWGIGQWTADMAGIAFFRDPDIWPNLDVSARKTLEQLTGADAMEVSEQFAPHRTYLAMYMWRFRDNPPVL